MGTYFTTGASQADIVDELLDPLKKSGHLVTSRVCQERDGDPVLWTVEKGERDGNPYQFIGCYLLKWDKGGWGYKPMNETAGPYYYSVPGNWLDKYPCIMIPEFQHMLEHSREWRARVKVNNERQFVHNP